MTWQTLTPEEKIESVRALVQIEGHSYAQAAMLLGATSREAVAGVVERSRRTPNQIRSTSGLKNQKKQRKGAPPRRNGGDGTTVKAQRARAKAKAKPKHQGFNNLVPFDFVPVARGPIDDSAWLALPGSAPVTVERHKDGCRFPIGAELPFLFCNEPATDDGPYCAVHARLAFREPPPKKGTKR